MTTAVGEFAAVADPFRGELLAHCYRMLGSRHDAEDAVQDTYVRAWRAYSGFEGRSSLRRWLYTIATRVCLSAIEGRARRPLPSGLGPPAGGEPAELTADTRVPWLEPLPDALVLRDDADPASVVAARAGIRLAFVAALQNLPARQRAALVLCDVLRWPAAAAADSLGTTAAGVNSALQRARSHLRSLGLVVDDIAEPAGKDVRALLDRYADAFARADLEALAALLRDDVELEMPPHPLWFRGRKPTLDFLGARVLRAPGAWHLVPTRANGQPALRAYERDAGGELHGHALHVLSLDGQLITRITAYVEVLAR